MVARTLLTVGAMLSAASASNLRELPAGQVCDLENGFDYEGHDLKNVPGSVDTCCTSCIKTSGCVAWSWNTYQNGTCWLKNGLGNILVNPSVKSARAVWTATGSNYCKKYADIDFVGNDIGNVKKPKFEDCCEVCRTTLGCRAYSWSNHEGGTCWLKSKRDKIISKKGVASGDAYQNGYPLFQPAFVIEEGVDYYDHDIGSKLADSPLKCGQLCYDFQGSQRCNAFAWNNYQGGTCWFKSEKGTVISKGDVTSGYIVGPEY